MAALVVGSGEPMSRSFAFLLGCVVSLGGAVTLGGCTPAATASSHDMSAAGHEEAAGAETAEAEAHEAEAEALERSGPAAAEGGPIWTVDPSRADALRLDAARHREAAAAHRASAEALRAAEDRACAGLPDTERAESPFSHREDIADVRELTEEEPVGSGATVSRVIGATIVFRPVPGLTAEWLTRLVECHLARNSALGHDVPEMGDCPLVPAGVTAHVRTVIDGFAVDVRAPGADGAREVLRRAHAMVD